MLVLCCKDGTSDVCALEREKLYYYGRSLTCNIKPAGCQHRVSRKHAILRVALDGSVELQDNASTFGTWLKPLKSVGNTLAGHAQVSSWQRLTPAHWYKLVEGDTFGFGAPSTILEETRPNPNVYMLRSVTRGTCPRSPGASNSDNLQRANDAGVLHCPICHDLMAASYILACGHASCGCCLLRWLQQKPTCHLCRAELAAKPVRCVSIDLAVAEAAAHHGQQEHLRRRLEDASQQQLEHAFAELLQSCHAQGPTCPSSGRQRAEGRGPSNTPNPTVVAARQQATTAARSAPQAAVAARRGWKQRRSTTATTHKPGAGIQKPGRGLTDRTLHIRSTSRQNADTFYVRQPHVAPELATARAGALAIKPAAAVMQHYWGGAGASSRASSGN